MLTFEWPKSERYMTTFKMSHVVSSCAVLKICQQLQKLLTGVHDVLSWPWNDESQVTAHELWHMSDSSWRSEKGRSVHTWFDRQVGE